MITVKRPPFIASLLCCIAATLFLQSRPALSASFYIPNGSFENPPTVFVDTNIVDWQKSPQPFWYDPSANGPWSQLTGVFINPPPDSTNNDHLVNIDGTQAAFLFALPGVALSQELTASQPNRLNHVFKAGRNYDLTVAVLGNGGGMAAGSPLTLNLYYLDSSNAMVTVASTTVTNSSTLFPDHNHFVDFTARFAAVSPLDAAVGKTIGIQIVSTADFSNAGGYWDIDNVRLIESIAVPNFSFELPGTVFVDTNILAWQKSPAPAWYDESANGPWAQLTGVFLNTPQGDTNHIDNMDGSQAVFFFALPQVALFQDKVTSSNAFNIQFEPGQSYQLTGSFLGQGGGLADGATVMLGLYYLDGQGNQVTVASTLVTNNGTVFPNHTHFVDFQTRLAGVKASDAWAGKNLGVQLLSAVDFQTAGGYWDIDNVRLTALQAPVLSAATASNSQVQITLLSEPGAVFDVLASSSISASVSSWTNVTTVTNVTGKAIVTDSVSGVQQRYYQARQVR